MSPLIIGVDFDGTIVEHMYPAIGAAVPGAIETLKACTSRGARLILWTMRDDRGEDGPVLSEAVAYLKRAGVDLWGVNSNPEQDWSASPKAYCHIYVDDASAGCPLVTVGANRKVADWEILAPILLRKIDERS